jgi:DNA-binding response OmpR family regulator
MSKHDTILMVDQDSELVAILGAYLGTQGYRVVFTTRVREALKKVASQKFGHIFLDPELPPDDSIKIVRELCTPSSINLITPLTIMTTNENFLFPMSVVKRIDALLMKPFTLQEFAFRADFRESRKSNLSS